MTGRLQKKCFIASVGFHLLLVVILFVGPAFVSSRKKPDPTDPIAFVPSILIEEAISGGGSPQPQPAPRQHPTPTPQPAPPRVQPRVAEAVPAEKPRPQVKPIEPPKSVERDPDVLTTKPIRRLPNVNPNLVTRPRNADTSKLRSANNAVSKSNAADERFASAAHAAAQAVREGVASATSVQMNGPGGGGPTYASYNSEVARIYKERYDLALVSAGDIAEDQKLEVVATVTIARSGDVISARVSNPSPSRALNQLVQRVLDSIKFLREFPAEAKDQQRTLNILFDLKPKKAIG